MDANGDSIQSFLAACATDCAEGRKPTLLLGRTDKSRVLGLLVIALARRGISDRTGIHGMQDLVTIVRAPEAKQLAETD